MGRDAREHAPPRHGLRGWLDRHGRKLWWLHSSYALALGASIVFFARRGFEYSRWLVLLIVAAWFVTLLLFRVFGSGAAQRLDTDGRKLRFLVMTYVLKNSYQGMLFFALPFYWESATFDAPNAWYVALLGVLGVVSTLDLIFDRVVMHWKAVASVFYVLVMFSAAVIGLHAALPGLRHLWALQIGAFTSALAFWGLHVPPERWRRAPALAVLALGTAAAMGLVWVAQPAIPPVPVHVARAQVGPATLPDGRLALAVEAIHPSLLERMTALTDVVHPTGAALAEHYVHVWRRDRVAVARFAPRGMAHGGTGVLTLRSTLGPEGWPPEPSGRWTVDVETRDGQLAGRARFEVMPRSAPDP